MGNEFVPYEQALALKELGFNEICFGTWDRPDKLWIGHVLGIDYTPDDTVLAPTFSQCFRWFREKYRMKIWFNISQQVPYIDKYLVSIDVYDGFGVGVDFEEEFTTYEEAEFECLKKLIEIVKESRS